MLGQLPWPLRPLILCWTDYLGAALLGPTSWDCTLPSLWAWVWLVTCDLWLVTCTQSTERNQENGMCAVTFTVHWDCTSSYCFMSLLASEELCHVVGYLCCESQLARTVLSPVTERNWILPLQADPSLVEPHTRPQPSQHLDGSLVWPWAHSWRGSRLPIHGGCDTTNGGYFKPLCYW